MQNKMMYVQCPDDCFSVQGTNKDEIKDMMKMHIGSMHKDMKVTDKDIEKQITSC